MRKDLIHEVSYSTKFHDLGFTCTWKPCPCIFFNVITVNAPGPTNSLLPTSIAHEQSVTFVGGAKDANGFHRL